MGRSRWVAVPLLLVVFAVPIGCAHHPHLGTGIPDSSASDDSLIGSLVDKLIAAGTAGRPQ